MPRITKKAEERKTEILKTALDLFYQKGYEATTIEEIIHQIGIAKGTFYHYYKSKDDLLGDLANFQTDTVIALIQNELKDFKGNAIEKFQLIVSFAARWKFERKDLMMTYLNVLYNDKNITFRSKMYQSSEKLVPLFSETIAEGNKQGFFDVTDVDEATEIFLAMFQGFAERVAPRLLELPDKPETTEAVVQQYKTLEKAIERVLGAKEGTLKIFDPVLIREFFDYYIRMSKEKGALHDQ